VPLWTRIWSTLLTSRCRSSRQLPFSSTGNWWSWFFVDRWKSGFKRQSLIQVISIPTAACRWPWCTITTHSLVTYSHYARHKVGLLLLQAYRNGTKKIREGLKKRSLHMHSAELVLRPSHVRTAEPPIRFRQRRHAVPFHNTKNFSFFSPHLFMPFFLATLCATLTLAVNLTVRFNSAIYIFQKDQERDRGTSAPQPNHVISCW